MAPPRDLTNNDINRTREPIVSPYSNAYDPLSNVSNFYIIDSTLRGMYFLFNVFC